ncbi:hypothetical protein KCU61_g186, partial [Aureobasidium melanogenum]
MPSTSPTTFLAAKIDLTFSSLPDRRRRRCGVDLETALRADDIHVGVFGSQSGRTQIPQQHGDNCGWSLFQLLVAFALDLLTLLLDARTDPASPAADAVSASGTHPRSLRAHFLQLAECSDGHEQGYINTFHDTFRTRSTARKDLRKWVFLWTLLPSSEPFCNSTAATLVVSHRETSKSVACKGCP